MGVSVAVALGVPDVVGVAEPERNAARWLIAVAVAFMLRRSSLIDWLALGVMLARAVAEEAGWADAGAPPALAADVRGGVTGVIC
jgi:hypothetical protein